MFFIIKIIIIKILKNSINKKNLNKILIILIIIISVKYYCILIIAKTYKENKLKIKINSINFNQNIYINL